MEEWVVKAVKVMKVMKGYYICAACGYVNVSLESGKEFVSYANCGVRTDIRVSPNAEELIMRGGHD